MLWLLCIFGIVIAGVILASGLVLGAFALFIGARFMIQSWRATF